MTGSFCVNISLMLAFFIFVLGIVFGSFVNALTWRIHKKKDWVKDRSICPRCKHVLGPLDLVPIISWLMLRGKCRYCHKKIEDNPLVEVGVGIAFLISYLQWPYGFDAPGIFRFVVWLIAIVLLATMLVYDLKHMILPDKLTGVLAVLAVVQLLVLAAVGDLEGRQILFAGVASVLGGGIFHLIYIASSGKYIGGGDVKLGYAYGLLLIDPILPWFVLMAASLIGSLIAVVLMLSGKAGMKTKLPFGPMLVMGVFAAMLWGLEIWQHIGVIWD